MVAQQVALLLHSSRVPVQTWYHVIYCHPIWHIFTPIAQRSWDKLHIHRDPAHIQLHLRLWHMPALKVTSLITRHLFGLKWTSFAKINLFFFSKMINYFYVNTRENISLTWANVVIIWMAHIKNRFSNCKEIFKEKSKKVFKKLFDGNGSL